MTDAPRYTPTAGEARTHLRAWCTRRERLQADGVTQPSDWIPTAVGRVLDELDRYEEANAGMVLTSLEALPEGVL